MKLGLAAAFIAATVLLAIGSFFCIWRSFNGPHGSFTTRAERIRYRIFAAILFLLAAFCCFHGAVNLGDFMMNRESSPTETTAPEETLPSESESETEESGFSAEDMIPVVNLTRDEYEVMFGSSENRPFLNTSMPSMAQCRLALTTAYFKGGKQWISDALDVALWAKAAELKPFANVKTKPKTVVDLTDMEIGQMIDELAEADFASWKAECEALPKEERMKRYREEMEAKGIQNPVVTESIAMMLVDDIAVINNRERMQEVLNDYEAARQRTEEDVKNDGRGIGVSYWLDFHPDYPGDSSHLIIRPEQYDNAAFVLSVLRYYENADISAVQSVKHWPNNCAGEADMIAPICVSDPNKQESMTSYQLKYFDKSDNTLVSWIGFNEADSRPMRFAVETKTAGRKKASSTQAPTTEPETTVPPTNPAKYQLYIEYRYGTAAGPGVAGNRIAVVDQWLTAGTNYYYSSSSYAPKGYKLEEGSPAVISGELWSHRRETVYFVPTSSGGGRRPGGGGGGGKKPTEPAPTDPSNPKPTDPSPTDPTNPKPTDPNPTDPTDPSPTDPSPDGSGGKDPGTGSGPTGNAPHGGGDANGGHGETQNYPQETAGNKDHPTGESERESREQATQASREQEGKGDSSGTSSTGKTDPTISGGSGTTVEGGNPASRDEQPTGTNTATDTVTKDNGDGTSTTTEKTSDTRNDDVGGSFDRPTDSKVNGDGDGSATPISNDITPARSAEPAPAAPASSGNNTDNKAASGGEQSKSSGSSENTASNGGGSSNGDSSNSGSSSSGGGSNSSGGSDNGGGDGDRDDGGLSDSSPRDSGGSENISGDLGADPI